MNPAEGGDPKALKRLRRVFPGLRASLSRPGPVKAPGRDQGSKTPSERHRVNLVTHPLALGPGNRSPAWLCPKPPSALPAHGSPFRAGRGLVAGVQPEQNRQNTGGPSPDLLWLREPLRTLFQRPREQPAPTLGGAGASPQPFPSRPAPWTRDGGDPGVGEVVLTSSSLEDGPSCAPAVRGQRGQGPRDKDKPHSRGQPYLLPLQAQAVAPSPRSLKAPALPQQPPPPAPCASSPLPGSVLRVSPAAPAPTVSVGTAGRAAPRQKRSSCQPSPRETRPPPPACRLPHRPHPSRSEERARPHTWKAES